MVSCRFSQPHVHAHAHAHAHVLEAATTRVSSRLQLHVFRLQPKYLGCTPYDRRRGGSEDGELLPAHCHGRATRRAARASVEDGDGRPSQAALQCSSPPLPSTPLPPRSSLPSTPSTPSPPPPAPTHPPQAHVAKQAALLSQSAPSSARLSSTAPRRDRGLDPSDAGSISGDSTMGTMRRSKNAEEALQDRVNTLESKVFWHAQHGHTRCPGSGRAAHPRRSPTCAQRRPSGL